MRNQEFVHAFQIPNSQFRILKAPSFCRPRELLDDVGHLDCRDGGFIALVARAVTRPRECFLDRVRRQHTEGHRHTGRRGAAHQSVRDRRADVIEVRRLAPYDTPETDDRLEPSRFRRVLRGDRNLERTGHPDQSDLVQRDSGRGERRQRAALQAIGDEVVVFRDHDRETQARRRTASLNRRHVTHAPITCPSCPCGPAWLESERPRSNAEAAKNECIP